MAKAAELMLSDLARLESSYYALQSRLGTLSNLWSEIRDGGNKQLHFLHKRVFHDKLKLEGHGRLEGATVVTLLLPHDVAGCHLSNLQKIGEYSEALVALGMESDKDDEKAAASDLQVFCRCLWKLTRYMGDGLEVYETLSTEALFFRFIEEREAYYKGLAKEGSKAKGPKALPGEAASTSRCS